MHGIASAFREKRETLRCTRASDTAADTKHDPFCSVIKVDSMFLLLINVGQ